MEEKRERTEREAQREREQALTLLQVLLKTMGPCLLWAYNNEAAAVNGHRATIKGLIIKNPSFSLDIL